MESGSGGGGEKLDSQNPRGFMSEEDHYNNLHHSSATISDKRGPPHPVYEPLARVQSNRTLLDIIRDEGGGVHKDGRKSWRHFKDKLRRRPSGRGSSWTSTVPVPASDIPINNRNRMMSRHDSTRIKSNLDSDDSTQPDISAVPDARAPSLIRNSSRAIERANGRFDQNGRFPMRRLQREDNDTDYVEEEERSNGDSAEEEATGEGEEEKQPVRMSLMALLAETDGSAYTMDDEEDEEDEDEESGGGRGAEYSNCCVCMVRHKGEAFIPCGHTFCRLCSRELCLQKGKCPLCNNYILEIIDIF